MILGSLVISMIKTTENAKSLFFRIKHSDKIILNWISGHPFGHPHDVYSDVCNGVRMTLTTGVRQSMAKLSKRQSICRENQSKILP